MMTRAEIEALPKTFAATLTMPRKKLFREMYETWQSNNPANVGEVISMTLRLTDFKIPVTVEECDQERAYYDVRSKTIHLCYEFFAYANELAKRPRGTVDPMINDIVMFTTLHEIGHAVIDILHLRIDWNEEDAADEFALLALTGGRDDELARSIVMAPAEFFKRHGDNVTAEERDEHSSGAERSFDAICILYGRQRSAREKKLLGNRAEACVAHTDRVVVRWNKLLAPYTRIASGNAF